MTRIIKIESSKYMKFKKHFLKKLSYAGDERLTWWHKFFVAMPNLPGTISNVLIHNVFIKFYVSIIGLDPKYVGIIYLVFGIWNAINDPAIGVLIDRQRYNEKKGKLLYFMKVTVPLISISSFGMVFAQPSWPELLKFSFLLVLLFIYDTAYTAFTISFVSFKLLAVPNNKDRVDLSVVEVFVNNIGGLIGTIVPTLLLVGGGNNGIAVLVLGIVAGLNAFFYFITLKPLNETRAMYAKEMVENEKREGIFKDIWNNLKSALESKAFLTYVLYQVLTGGPGLIYFSVYLFLADDVWKLSGVQATIADIVPGVMLLIMAPLLGKFVKKIGAKNASIVSTIPTAFAFSMLFFVQNMYHAIIVYSMMRIAGNISQVSKFTMLGAIVDEDEQRTGLRRAGMYNGMNALLTIPSGGVQTAIFMFIISSFGYAEGAAIQTENAMLGIRLGASFVPAFFILLAIFPMFFSPISHKKELELSDYNKEKVHLKVTEHKI